MRNWGLGLFLCCSACAVETYPLGSEDHDRARLYEVREIVGAKVSVYDDALLVNLPDPSFPRNMYLRSVNGRVSAGGALDSPLNYASADGMDPSHIGAARTEVGPRNGFSGISADRRLFLMGLFEAELPCAAAPPALHFASLANEAGVIATSTDKIQPQLCQAFFIGDGLTGQESGAQQRFIVPKNAVRLRLGFAETNQPNDLADNDGQLFLRLQLRVSGRAATPCGLSREYSGDAGGNLQCAADEYCVAGQCTPKSEFDACSSQDRKALASVAQDCDVQCSSSQQCPELKANTDKAYHCWLANRDLDAKCDGGSESTATAQAFLAAEACARWREEVCFFGGESSTPTEVR